MLENTDLRAEWVEMLRIIATFPIRQNNASASQMKLLGKPANDSEEKMQLLDQTLLSLASLFSYEKAFGVLLDRGVDPTCPTFCKAQKRASTVTQTGHTSSGHEPWAQGNGSISQEKSDELRQGPLAWAAYTGNLTLVQSILDQGLNPNIKNRKGQTALYFAVQQPEQDYLRKDLEADKVSIVELLLQKGALLTAADASSGTIMLAHTFKARYSKLARLLIHSGVELPKGALTEGLWGSIDQGEEGTRRVLLERIQGARVGLPQVQWPYSGFGWSDENLNIAARLIRGGMMRVLGDAVQQYE